MTQCGVESAYRCVRNIAVTAFACSVSTLVACSSSGTRDAPAPPPIEDQQSSEPLPLVLQQLMEEPDLLSPVPSVVHTQTTANSGLQISYTSEAVRAKAPASQIELQWDFIQECLQQVASAPLVLVREGPAVPFTAADDVVRSERLVDFEITSIPIASASTLHGAVIQIGVDDFDGSLGSASFNLRSIMGRHVWLSNSLAERDYPFECARQQP